jgi:hypothetical protein
LRARKSLVRAVVRGVLLLVFLPGLPALRASRLTGG